MGFEDQIQTDSLYLVIIRLKRATFLEQKQPVGINHDRLIKMTTAKPDQYGKGRIVFGFERRTKLIKEWLRQKPKGIQLISLRD